MTGDNTDALSVDNIVAVAVQALRKDGDTPPIKTPYEAIALIGHSCMIAVEFKLVGLGEDHSIGLSDSCSPHLLWIQLICVIETSSETPSLLPVEWNANSTFAFRYAHPQSSMEYLLKVSRLGNNAVVFALALGDDKTTSFDIAVKDYVSESALPLSSTADLANTLKDVFISTCRLNDLIDLFKINVIQKLAPGLFKEGYEDKSQVQRMQEEQRLREQGETQRDRLREDPLFQNARPRPFDDPLATAPRRPAPGDFAPPGFENEFEIGQPPRGFQGGGDRNTMGIGDRDLYPPGLGPNDPFRGTLGPNSGGGSGGMHPSLNDPLFGRGRDGGYDPQAPPGSRYDPVGPGQGAPFGQGGGQGGWGGFGGDII